MMFERVKVGFVLHCGGGGGWQELSQAKANGDKVTKREVKLVNAFIFNRN
jgi:hypothetical protein